MFIVICQYVFYILDKKIKNDFRRSLPKGTNDETDAKRTLSHEKRKRVAEGATLWDK